MTGYRELIAGFRALGVSPVSPIIVHASLKALGNVEGGAEAVLAALVALWDTLVMPSFTYKTMVVPEVGPPDNGISYGSGVDQNAMAEFFRPKMPADRLMGALTEALRIYPQSKRSAHPILSFAGLNAVPILESQTMAEPLAPIRLLMESQGWVILLGVDHTVNTSIHYAEHLAARKQFVRWALTPEGVKECPGFPGCSDGFEQLTPHLENITHFGRVGKALVRALPVAELIKVARNLIVQEPLALLCERTYCERCQDVRRLVSSESGLMETVQ